MNKNVDTCFNCGKIIKTKECPYCGYSNTSEDTCPRKRGLLCVLTKKLCKVNQWRECEVLRDND